MIYERCTTSVFGNGNFWESQGTQRRSLTANLKPLLPTSSLQLPLMAQVFSYSFFLLYCWFFFKTLFYSVKLWNIKSMKCLDTLNANEGIIYCIAWAPGSDDRLIAASSKGPLILWDTKRGQLLLVCPSHLSSFLLLSCSPISPSVGTDNSKGYYIPHHTTTHSSCRDSITTRTQCTVAHGIPSTHPSSPRAPATATVWCSELKGQSHIA